MKLRGVMVVGLLAGVLACGCATKQPPVPHNLADYDKLRQRNPQAWPPQTIVARNLARVADPDLPKPERLASLNLVMHLSGEDPTAVASLGQIAAGAELPPELKETAYAFLSDKGHRIALGPAGVPGSPELRRTVLTQLLRKPRQQDLTKVVKFWAHERSTTGPNEQLYRHAAETIAGTEWDRALLNAINAEKFAARGSAIAVLARRMPISLLRARVAEVRPRSLPFKALKKFLNTFDYLPTSGVEFYSTTMAYYKQSEVLAGAARLYGHWHDNYGYNFNIRDFHLLDGIAKDPLRTDLRRTQLILEVGRACNARRHVRHKPSAPGAEDDYVDRFWLQVDSLTMADLWNLYLLNEMLRRPRVQLALWVISAHDRRDTTKPYGGLVFYRSGLADPTFYPYEKGEKVPVNDLVYFPPQRAKRDRRNALCRFHGHFEKAGNAARVGPTSGELRDARLNNYYGLVLTSISDQEFCAHYYNPRGVAVSLGVFPFRRQ